MATVTYKGNPLQTCGDLPALGSKAPGFVLTGTDLSDATLNDFAGKTVIMNIFPSIDTPVCAESMRRFNNEAAKLKDVVILGISADLPFAQQRYCAEEGLDKIVPLSVFRSPGFGKDYGVCIITGPQRGLLARAVVVVNSSGTVIYTQQVPKIEEEPDYEAVLASLHRA
ncbi:MAG TPA: thiol peroxidase [Thermodesulfobacteriota bacterium]|nr:thiol peroxidase [Deltaproteobacteria bacterium]HNR11834.1 thiol peroxidase [Thermodesulfobacteriota bacterium]HNU70552.1 thiol peroxidase [Thermodesulfobacteriota bacterium]HQO78626.1 thiol peroxidase [Thermodesulfobacteriota bacterium]